MPSHSHHISVCPHDCPSVCALEIEQIVDHPGERGRLGKVHGSERNPYTAGVICAKVGRYAERFHHPDRLTRPLRRTGAKGSGSFAPEGRPTALINPADAARLRIEAGDPVRLGNERGSVLVHAAIRAGQQPGVLVVESIWPNGAFEEGIGINLLISAEAAPPNGGAAFHDTAVWLRPEPEAARSQASTPAKELIEA